MQPVRKRRSFRSMRLILPAKNSHSRTAGINRTTEIVMAVRTSFDRLHIGLLWQLYPDPADVS